MSDAPHGPPPVEPLPDVAWARVERGLMARLDSAPSSEAVPPARRRWIWLAVPALAAAAVLVVVFALRGPVAQDTHVGTDPEVSRVVSGDAPSAVSFADAHVELASRSAIVMSREGAAPSVLLERGTASFTVAPREGRPAFVVRAGDTVVRVVGTQFQVARTDEHVAVVVRHGIVDVLFRGTTVRVAAGYEWHSEHPEAVTTVAIADPAPAPTPAPAHVPGPENTNPTPTPGAQSTRPIPTPGPGPQITRPIPTPDPTPQITKPVPMPTPTATVESDRAKYDRLSRLEISDPKAALSGYLELSRGSSEWAAIGLYAAGRLAADRGDPRATTFLTIYLRRFPSGANVSDARTLLQRLQGDPR